jgi:hypothetical protein
VLSHKFLTAKETRPELIVWIDAKGGGGWESLKDRPEPRGIVCYTIGWVIGESPEAIEVIQTISPINESCVEDITIPKDYIQSRTRIKLPAVKVSPRVRKYYKDATE